MVTFIEVAGFQYKKSKFYIKELAIIKGKQIYTYILPCPTMNVFAKDAGTNLEEAMWQIRFQECMHGLSWNYNPFNIKKPLLFLRSLSWPKNESYFAKGADKCKNLSKIFHINVQNIETTLISDFDYVPYTNCKWKHIPFHPRYCALNRGVSLVNKINK